MSKFVESIKSAGDYEIAFSCPKSNWDIHINSDGKALSIATAKGCESTFFGDVNHIRKLIANNLFNDELAGITEHGRKCLSGMYSKLFTDFDGNQFHVLRFN